jgi:hypothetical protein
MPICIHCDVYNNVPQRLRTIVQVSNTVKIYKRYCRHVEKDRQGEDVSCENFKPYHMFWCERFTYRLHLLQCLNRQRIKMEGCRNCPQADDIMDVARGRDLYELFGVNRKVHLQNKKQKKPKLRRRKA